MWPIKWHYCQCPWMTLNATFAVWNVSNSHNSWNSMNLLTWRVMQSLCGSWASCFSVSWCNDRKWDYLNFKLFYRHSFAHEDCYIVQCTKYLISMTVSLVSSRQRIRIVKCLSSSFNNLGMNMMKQKSSWCQRTWCLVCVFLYYSHFLKLWCDFWPF